jgi:hypothetical protein
MSLRHPLKILVDTDKMPGKSKDGKDGKDGKPGKRSIEVSFFDIFTPGRTIRQAKVSLGTLLFH